jgi:hypothetical protein
MPTGTTCMTVQRCYCRLCLEGQCWSDRSWNRYIMMKAKDDIRCIIPSDREGQV